MLWLFQEGQHSLSSYSIAKIGGRREGFPSWSWVGWITGVSNINHSSLVKLPLLSLLRNVEITYHSPLNAASQSTIVLDESITEDRKAVTRQQIRLNSEPTKLSSNLASLNTLGFDAERTEWKNFTVEGTTAPGPIFLFGLSGKSSQSGFLSVVPDEKIWNGVFNRGVRETPEAQSNWSLVRLYHLKLRPWEDGNDELQEILEHSRAGDVKMAKKFRRRLQQTDLLYVLLIKRHGQYWERQGSGLMFQHDWPSSNKRAKVRAFQERIVLV